MELNGVQLYTDDCMVHCPVPGCDDVFSQGGTNNVTRIRSACGVTCPPLFAPSLPAWAAYLCLCGVLLHLV